MKLFYRVSADFLVVLGTIHIVLTPLWYRGLSLKALWFAGAGLALIYLGLINIASAQVSQPWYLTMCIVCNLIGAVFGIFALIASPTIVAIVICQLFFAVTVGSIDARIKV